MTQVDIVYPTPLQLALATVILKSKPADVSVRDYIATLRAQICKTASTPPYRQETYLDGVEHWKLRCEQLEEEKSKLLTELSESRTKDGGSCKAAAKRQRNNSHRQRKLSEPQLKRATEEGSSKRLRRDQQDSSNTEVMAQGLGTTHTDSTEPKKYLVTLLFRINCLLQSDPSLNSHDLAFDIVSSCQQVSKIIETTCGRVDDLNTTELMLPVGRALAALFHAAGKLKYDAKDGHRSTRGAVVYAAVIVAETVLNAISANCLQRALLEQDPRQLHRADLERLKAATEVPRLLTNLLLANINLETLLPSNELHRSIFEGMAYLILQQTGTCLAILVHGRDTDDAGQPIPVIKEASKEVERVAFTHKATHLGPLVDRVANLAPKYLSPPDGPKLARSKTVKATATTGRRTEGGLSDMHPLVKTKLQKTLIGFLGSRNEDHDEFLDCLKMPRRVLLKEPRVPKTEKQRMKDEPVEWFVEKAWSAVGWDILRQEDD